MGRLFWLMTMETGTPCADNEKRDEHIRKLAGGVVLLFVLGLLAMANWGIIWPELFFKPVVHEHFGFGGSYHASLRYRKKYNWLPGPKVVWSKEITEQTRDE